VRLTERTVVIGSPAASPRSPAVGKTMGQRLDPVLNFKTRVPVSLRHFGLYSSPRLNPREAHTTFRFHAGLGFLFQGSGKLIDIPNQFYRIHPSPVHWS
jgi:hypothetical protein